MEWAGNLHSICYSYSSGDGTLTGKNLLPYRQEIRSGKITIPDKSNKVGEIILAIPFYSMFEMLSIYCTDIWVLTVLI